MEQNMRDAVPAGNSIDRLYQIIRENPSVLDTIDDFPFVETPAHLAASLGFPHFAMEVLNLKPSFGRKLDLDGNGLVQVAIKSNQRQRETVELLVNYDPEILRVKGRMGYTPLLDCVEIVPDRDYHRDILALFLLRCPKCIEDLNIYKESAVHVALRSGNMDAFMVLLGWLQQTSNLNVLDWEDENGDTALHVAAAATADNTEVIRLLIQHVEINKRNRRDLTALSIAIVNVQNPNGIEITKMLRSAGAKESTDPYLPPTPTLSQGLVYKESPITRLLQGRRRNREGKSLENLSAETRSTLLVVAVLIISATYQAVLSPPGGLTSGPDGVVNASESAGMLKTHYGKVQIDQMSFFILLFLNSVPFVASVVMIIMLLPKTQYKVVFAVPLLSLVFSYSVSAVAICPRATESSRRMYVIATLSAAMVIYIGSLFIHILRTYL